MINAAKAVFIVSDDNTGSFEPFDEVLRAAWRKALHTGGMKNLACIMFGSTLLMAACGDSKSAANDGGGGLAGSAAGSAGGTSAVAGSAGGPGGSIGTAGSNGTAGSGVGGSTGAAGAGGATGAGGGGGTAGGGGGTAGGAECARATTAAACNALSGCYAVYTAEPRTPVGSCTCPDYGCCSQFSFCASGAHATCTGPVTCRVATPYCEPTFSVANDGSCWLGCVKSSACAP
jgi:hypothetical protein